MILYCCLASEINLSISHSFFFVINTIVTASVFIAFVLIIDCVFVLFTNVVLVLDVVVIVDVHFRCVFYLYALTCSYVCVARLFCMCCGRFENMFVLMFLLINDCMLFSCSCYSCLKIVIVLLIVFTAG